MAISTICRSEREVEVKQMDEDDFEYEEKIARRHEAIVRGLRVALCAALLGAVVTVFCIVLARRARTSGYDAWRATVNSAMRKAVEGGGHGDSR